MQNKNLIWLGTIVNTHNLNGELKILSDSDQIEEHFSVGNALFLENGTKLHISSFRIHKNFILIKFKEIIDFDEAKKLKNQRLFLPKEKLENDEFYIVDAIGADVWNRKEKIGVIINYFDQGKYYSFSVKDKNKNIFNIPIIDPFIDYFDKKEKKLFVLLPEGYLNFENEN